MLVRSHIGEGSLFVLLVEEPSFGEIELPLDPAPRFVFELALAKTLIDVLPFGGDQKLFELLVHRAGCPMVVITIASELDMAKPFAVAYAQWLDDVFREATHGGKPFELGDDCFNCGPPRLLFLH